MESDQGCAPDLPLVSVVDDDKSIRESLPDLVRQFGFAARRLKLKGDPLKTLQQCVMQFSRDAQAFV
ncbi:MAG: hypothetical protein ABSD75_05035 [Terriglobales bacterium]|jgi:FixJ family two-component response regulator